MATLDDAKSYIGDGFGATYDAWIALDDATMTKTLTAAARYLNRFPWLGTFTGTMDTNETSLVWPRSGVVIDGVEVDSATTPDDVMHGWFEMAVLINADSTLPSKMDQSSNIQSANAGGAGVTYFAPTSVRAGTATAIPVQVLRLVSRYLATPAGANEGGIAGVGKGCSSMASRNQFTLVRAEE